MSSKPIILTFAITPGTGTLSREIATGVNTYKISTIVDEFEKALFFYPRKGLNIIRMSNGTKKKVIVK